jgi:hypothetical protein
MIAMDVGGDDPSGPIHRGVFFDGVRMRTDQGPEVLLRRVLIDGRERFALLTPIAYWDYDQAEPHVVPAANQSFYSDLTSVPFMFTWLVPRTGRHLLAALLHDGLVGSQDAGPTYRGPKVTRTEADLIFRRALCSLGISPARAWLMWTAVTLATIQAEARSAAAGSGRRWAVMVGTLSAVLGVGALATLDLFDVVALLPWMGHRPWHTEVVYGALAAILAPALLALLWGKLWRAGMIAGIALAWLLHVSALVVALAAGFRIVEWVSSRFPDCLRKTPNEISPLERREAADLPDPR